MQDKKINCCENKIKLFLVNLGTCVDKSIFFNEERIFSGIVGVRVTVDFFSRKHEFMSLKKI